MNGRKLTRIFFARSTLVVAKELLGKFLVRRIRASAVRVLITETEAYCGQKDLASHASRGRTKRTEVMFGLPGHAYVYFVYGMYFCLNVVTERDGVAGAVLIRGIQLETSNQKPVTSLDGPGKLCRFLKIDKALNGEDLTKSRRLWVEEGVKLKPGQIGRSSRVNIGYAGAYKDKPWRFTLMEFTPHFFKSKN